MPRKTKKAKKRYRPNPTLPTTKEVDKPKPTKKKPNFGEGFDAGRQAGDILANILIGGLMTFLGASVMMSGGYPRQPAPPPDPEPAPPAPQIEAPNVVTLTKKKDGTYGE